MWVAGVEALGDMMGARLAVLPSVLLSGRTDQSLSESRRITDQQERPQPTAAGHAKQFLQGGWQISAARALA